MNNDTKRLLEIAIYAGKLMLENGAETYRVEETINMISRSGGIKNVQNFTIPTGIFLSCEHEGVYYSYVECPKLSRIDLEIISLVNDFSRKFVNAEMDLNQSEKRLLEIEISPMYPLWVMTLFGAISGSFATLMFGGNLVEFISAFITSFLVVFGIGKIEKILNSFYIKNVLGGMINASSALLMVYIFKYFTNDINIDKIIIGSILPLVPGVSIVNALRDSISGDLVSGMSKFTESVIIAVALAIGVGLILNLRMLFAGG